MRPVLANLGFILQIAGLLMIIPILASFYFNETQSLISFFITAIVFFGTGFLMNAFSVREKLNFISSCILLTSVFFLLGLIGSIPYLYTNVFGDTTFLSRFSDSYFESISGYTTTGLTMLKDVDNLPKSMILYRALTQLIGGIGIVFILLAFFYPTNELTKLGRVLGLEKITEGIKKVFTHVLFVYVIYALIFIFVLYLFFGDFLNSISLAFTTISTGGFSPVTNFSNLIINGSNWLIAFMLILGATNFMIHYKLFRGRFKHIFKAEFVAFLIIILLAFIGISMLSGLDISTSFFHTVSASTNSGFSFMNLQALNEQTKLIMIFIMLVGGMTISTAGGIKILRLLIFLKSIPWVLRKLIFNRKEPLELEGREFSDKDVLTHLIVPFITVFVLFVSTWVFTLYGYSFTDSLFDTTSAMSTTGYTTGIITTNLPVELKWWTVVLMVLGRIEIIPFLVTLTSIKPRKK